MAADGIFGPRFAAEEQRGWRMYNTRSDTSVIRKYERVGEPTLLRGHHTARRAQLLVCYDMRLVTYPVSALEKIAVPNNVLIVSSCASVNQCHPAGVIRCHASTQTPKSSDTNTADITQVTPRFNQS